MSAGRIDVLKEVFRLRLADLDAFFAANGRLPTRSKHDLTELRLAEWLTNQRASERGQTPQSRWPEWKAEMTKDSPAFVQSRKQYVARPGAVKAKTVVVKSKVTAPKRQEHAAAEPTGKFDLVKLIREMEAADRADETTIAESRKRIALRNQDLVAKIQVIAKVKLEAYGIPSAAKAKPAARKPRSGWLEERTGV